MAEIFSEMHLNTDIVIEQKEDYLVFDIQGEELGILIAAAAIRWMRCVLLNLVINRKSSSKTKSSSISKITVPNGKRPWWASATSCRQSQTHRQKVILEPMNPQERRIIHMTLQDDDTVNTYSEGEEPYRKVIIVPKKKQQNRRK